VSSRDTIETNAVCMVWGIACIAEEEDLFVLGVTTYGTGSGLFLFKFVLDPSIWVEFGNLFLVFDLVFGYDSAWQKELAS
jgi:hypothetical protein